MANISDAFGTVTIGTDDLNNLATFLYLQQKSNQNAYYDTTLELEIDKITTLEKIQKYVNNYHHKKDGQYYVSLSFDATGRWTFENNAEWFFKSVFQETDALVDTIKTKAFYATFEFLEEESGFAFIADSTIDIKWDPSNQEQYTIDYQTTEYEYTAENLIKLRIFDKNEVWDTAYILKHPKDFENELKDIASIDMRLLKDANLPAILENLSEFLTAISEKDSQYVYRELEDWLEYECPNAFKIPVEQA